MTDLFSTGFEWGDDDVSQTAATPAATPCEGGSTREKIGISDVFGRDVAPVASVAETEGQALLRRLSQSPVAGSATPAATPETADFCGVTGETGAIVAPVATWLDGIAMLREQHAPIGADGREWRRLVQDARTLNTLWGDDLRQMGWSAADVFGVEPNPAHRRLDRLGLVTFVNGGAVVAVDAGSATLLWGGRDHLTFFRQGRPIGAVPLWEVSPAYPRSDVGDGRGRGRGVRASAYPSTGPAVNSALGGR